METISLKSLAEKVLQRNQLGNSLETQSFHTGKLEGVKVSKVSGAGNYNDPMRIEEQIEKEIEELRPCRVCHENAWWLSVYGALRCGVCHPPVPGAVKKWIGAPECSARLEASGPAVVLSWEEARQRKAPGGSTYSMKV